MSLIADAASVGLGDVLTRDQAFRRLRNHFSRGGIETPDLDARLLLCHACGISFEAFVKDPDILLSEGEPFKLLSYEKRRLGGEPVSRILGRRSFWRHEFTVTQDTLDPRPDTEVLVEAALWVFREEAFSPTARIVDLGTGSGCILVSLLGELPQARGLGVDIRPGALVVARENARQACVDDRADFVAGDWFAPLYGSFDMIVSNPPYIPTDEIGGLKAEVSEFDPYCALDGGVCGLQAYRAIISQLKAYLKPGGAVLFEVGAGQDIIVKQFLEENGFDIPNKWVQGLPSRDLGGHIRVVAGMQRS